MTQLKNSGGSRANSGRNPVPDRKIQVYVMLRQSIVNILGEKEVKNLMAKAVVWYGRFENLTIKLNAEMKIAQLTPLKKTTELVEILWDDDDKPYIEYENKIYYLSQFTAI